MISSLLKKKKSINLTSNSTITEDNHSLPFDSSKLLKDYVLRISEDYNNYSDFERKGVKPVIQQLSVFDLK